jgi:ankyrin repeat protein
MSLTDDLLFAFEIHSPEKIRGILSAGLDPNTPINGKPPILILVEMYLRSLRFTDCLSIMLEAGATLNDPLFEILLLDDHARLRKLFQSSPDSLQRRFSLDCAFTSLQGVSALHICAEYNSIHCAQVLLDAGLDVNVRADLDLNGFGGHTPIFHAVNSNQNHCRPVMELLVDSGADLGLRLKGLVWGSGFEWETLLFDVTPISYAQCGLYFQFHRPEHQVYSNITCLFRKRYSADPPLRNVPNKYLQDSRVFPPRT